LIVLADQPSRRVDQAALGVGVGVADLCAEMTLIRRAHVDVARRRSHSTAW
jgi:hypothetical protein